MTAWLMANLVNIVVVGIVLLLLVLDGRSIWKNLKRGGSCCDCGCSGNCSCCGEQVQNAHHRGLCTQHRKAIKTDRKERGLKLSARALF